MSIVMRGTAERLLRVHRTRQQGAVAVSFIILVVLLLGFMGLATDAGRLYVSKAELQNAADSCALAAASALTGANAGQLTVAENNGITAGSRNLIGMQAVPVSIPADSAVTFSATLDGSYQTKDAVGAPLTMRYARCTLEETHIPTLILQVIELLGQSAGPSTVRASAVASLEPSISNCGLPLAVCKKPGSSAPHFGYAVGEWMIGRFQPAAGVTGKFKWVEFPGYERVKDLADLIAKGGQCDLNGTPTLEPHTGVVNSLVDVWNWRFGVKKPSGAPAGAYPPDFSGYAYTPANWPAQANAYPDFVSRRAANAPWNNQPDLKGGWSESTKEVHAAGSDRRMVVLPVVDCSSWDSGGTSSQTIEGWSCNMLLNPVANPNMDMGIEYRGPADTIASGCVTSGAPGGPGAGGPKVPALVQ